MTILKNVLLSLAIAPLALSIAFAQGGNDPTPGIDVIIKREKPVANVNINQSMTARENRTIKRLDSKAMASSENKYLEHNEIKSECYRRWKYDDYDNNYAYSITTLRSYEACLKGEDMAEMYRPPAGPDDFTEYSPTE